MPNIILLPNSAFRRETMRKTIAEARGKKRIYKYILNECSSYGGQSNQFIPVGAAENTYHKASISECEYFSTRQIHQIFHRNQFLWIHTSETELWWITK